MSDSNLVKSNLPCPDCGSSDALAIYDDGHTSCFSCSKVTQSNKVRSDLNLNIIPRKERKVSELEVGGEFVAARSNTDEFLDRGIDEDVCAKFGVKAKKDSSGQVEKIIFPYFDESGNYVAQKMRVRGIAGKGLWKGTASEGTLFGQNLFQNGKKLMVVEGEWDALAAYQLFGKRWPVVSIKNGADKTGTGPVNEFKKQYDYFRNFDEVIICFDNDEPGRISAEKCAQILPVGKAKIMTLSKYKDANEYLKAGAVKEFTDAFWNARALMPQGIVLGSELLPRIEKKLAERKARNGVLYPWDGVNKMTYGIRRGEMITMVAGTGVGKSAVIGHMAHHILKTTSEKIALMMMEESVEMANLRLMSIEGRKPLHLPDTEYTAEELKYLADQTIHLKDEEENDRVIAFDHFGSNSIDEIMYRVDHFAALGCKYIFLDHISIIVSDQQSGDERRALDEIATKLRTKVQEHDLCLFLVSHLRRPSSKPHEEGGQTSLADIRGTAGIGQLSDLVLGLERNGQADDPIERNTTKIRVLKNRFSGATGLATELFFDHGTGLLTEIQGEFTPTPEKEDKPVFDVVKFGERDKDAQTTPQGRVREIVDAQVRGASPPGEKYSDRFDFDKGDEVSFG